MITVYGGAPTEIDELQRKIRRALSPEGDDGDEDDPTDLRMMNRAFVGWTIREGRTMCVWPARRVLSPPEHDMGDEEPVMMVDFGWWAPSL